MQSYAVAFESVLVVAKRVSREDAGGWCSRRGRNKKAEREAGIQCIVITLQRLVLQHEQKRI